MTCGWLEKRFARDYRENYNEFHLKYVFSENRADCEQNYKIKGQLSQAGRKKSILSVPKII